MTVTAASSELNTGELLRQISQDMQESKKDRIEAAQMRSGFGLAHGLCTNVLAHGSCTNVVL